jgi:hypothetical protein
LDRANDGTISGGRPPGNGTRALDDHDFPANQAFQAQDFRKSVSLGESCVQPETLCPRTFGTNWHLAAAICVEHCALLVGALAARCQRGLSEQESGDEHDRRSALQQRTDHRHNHNNLAGIFIGKQVHLDAAFPPHLGGYPISR